ncbi:sensor histidine kinase [Ornithinimicrobium sp. LYQ92]|uniref:sensor histidine kinase n=1 Tax=Serinicoccus sp. LYQ92 TaxID=3378798 RepID=UPI003852116C
MQRPGTEVWAGLVMLVLSGAVAVPVVTGIADPTVPRGWWVVTFAVFLGTLLLSLSETPRLRIRYAAYASSVVLAWVVVLTLPQMGLVLILLVLTAACSVYLLPLWGSLLVVGLNTVVVVAVVRPLGENAPESVVTVGFYLMIQLASMLSSATLLRERQMRLEITAANVELQAAGVLLSDATRTAERLRISRELHDQIGHQLTVLTLRLETARHVDEAAAREHLEHADRVARELLRDVRSTVGLLRTQAPDLESSLQEMTRGLPGLQVSVEVDPGVRLEEPLSTALVRAAQEAVTNTIRHAQAQQLRIEVGLRDAHVVLVAQDDGYGDRDLVLGNGLLGLRERLSTLGGEVTLDGRDGFRLTASVPVP